MITKLFLVGSSIILGSYILGKIFGDDTETMTGSMATDIAACSGAIVIMGSGLIAGLYLVEQIETTLINDN